MRHALSRSILLLAAFGLTVEIRAGEPVSTIPPELILERFAVNKGGDMLLVPVKIAGKERLFLVDTACTKTIIDKTLPLGETKQVLRVGTPQGEANVKLFDAPRASVGAIPLGVDAAMGLDLKQIRESSGNPLEGILGMDFLNRYVVHVDFDHGELLLLKSAPKDPGEASPLRLNSWGIPELEAEVSRDQKVRFMIDTGHVGGGSGSMGRRSLRWSGDFQQIGSTLAEDVSGTHDVLLCQGKRLSLGSFSVDQPIFVEARNTGNLLGLGFWSRFVVTFDFPKQKLYLRKGIEYGRADGYLEDLSGLTLLRKDGAVVVHSVNEDGPAALAGIQTGDVLLTLGTSRADETTLFEMRKALSQGGQLACSVRRGSEERRLTLSLPR